MRWDEKYLCKIAMILGKLKKFGRKINDPITRDWVAVAAVAVSLSPSSARQGKSFASPRVLKSIPIHSRAKSLIGGLESIFIDIYSFTYHLDGGKNNNHHPSRAPGTKNRWLNYGSYQVRSPIGGEAGLGESLAKLNPNDNTPDTGISRDYHVITKGYPHACQRAAPRREREGAQEKAKQISILIVFDLQVVWAKIKRTQCPYWPVVMMVDGGWWRRQVKVIRSPPTDRPISILANRGALLNLYFTHNHLANTVADHAPL